jgi:hypothetical protein
MKWNSEAGNEYDGNGMERREAHGIIFMSWHGGIRNRVRMKLKGLS